VCELADVAALGLDSRIAEALRRSKGAASAKLSDANQLNTFRTYFDDPATLKSK
jgi:hypothetical protein